MRIPSRSVPAPVDLGTTGLAAFSSRHDAAWCMAAHEEPWHKLLLVLEGQGRLEHPAGAVALAPSHLVLVVAGSRHRIVDAADDRLTLLGICIDHRRLEAACGADWEVLRRRLAAGVVLGRTARDEAVRLFGALLAGGRRRRGASLADWGRLLHLLAIAATGARPSQRPRPHAGVEATLRWIDDHLAEPMAIATLAARAGLGYRTFTGVVRRQTGESVLTRILRLRLERAHRLLSSGMPVLEAALASGFGDLSGFYRQFRRRYGLPPGQVRDADRATMVRPDA